ncbi:MAG: L,D-transpeptidase family protein [Pseudomonadota bacterium]
MRLIVEGAPGAADAILRTEIGDIPARIGRSGLLAPGVQKVEGDGATPVGRFALRTVYWRPDRGPRPATSLPTYPIRPDDLWCDDPDHVLYNRPVSAPFASGHERLWLATRSYDICVVLDYNLARPTPGEGSAIFFHLTTDDVNPKATEGCVAVAPNDMHRLLPSLSFCAKMDIRYTDAKLA